MPPTSINLHPLLPPPPSTTTTTNNPLPPFLHTPSGLAILELQGTLNISAEETDETNYTTHQTPVGTLSFPKEFFEEGYRGKNKAVCFLYVGSYQRLRGEMRELGRPLGVVRVRGGGGGKERGIVESGGNSGEEEEEELEIVEIVRWKLVFGSRPEPVS